MEDMEGRTKEMEETIENNTNGNSENLAVNVINDYVRLRELYCENKLSAEKIAKIAGVSKTTVLQKLKKFGIRRRKSGRLISTEAKANLENYDEMNGLYNFNKLSLRQIAKKLGVSKKAVRDALISHRIPLRSPNKPINPRIKIEKAELERLYIEEELSAREIARRKKLSPNMVYRKMRKFGIPRRTTKEHQKVRYSVSIPISDELEQFLIGSLLGDGFLKNSIVVSSYHLKNKFNEYRDYVVSLLERNGYSAIKRKHISHLNTIMFSLTSESSIELQQYREKWYPDGIKCVPEDLQLTPRTCLHWYLEDGGLNRRKTKRKIYDVKGIYLCTNCFTTSEVDFLIKQLKLLLGVRKGITKTKNLEIRMCKSVGLKFLEYIGGRSPIRCFDYKFDPSLRAPKPLRPASS